jgi:uncharacterized protein (DUF1697 family)
MARQVAFLRGVNNIGATRRVAMADLRRLFERLGFRDVGTVLNSGNVVFSVPAGQRGGVLARIQEGLSRRLDVAAQVTLMSASEVAAAVRENPFAAVAKNSKKLPDLLVVVLRRRSDQARLEPLLEERWAPEALALGRRVAYLWCAHSVAKSRLWPMVDRALKRTGTARNMATMMKLMALTSGTAARGVPSDQRLGRRRRIT